MRDRRLDRGVTAAGILLILFGLIALIWFIGAETMPAFGQLAPLLMPLLVIGLGFVVIVIALDGGRNTKTAPAAPITHSDAAPRPEVALQPMAMDLADADRADVEIGFAAGRLNVGAAAEGHLVDGSIVGGRVVRDAPGRVRIVSDDPWLEWVPGLQRDWTIGVTSAVPVRMEVKAAAADVAIDCQDLRLDELVIRAGASSVRVRAAAHGMSRIRTEAGAGSLDVTVPPGVAARVRTTALLGGREIDLGRFPVVPGGYASPDFEQATDRVEIDAQTALGSLRVR